MRSSQELVSPVTGTGRSQISGIEPYAGPWGQPELLHLLRRTMFGVSIDHLDAFTGLSMDAAVDMLLTEAADSPIPVNDYNDDDLVDPNVALGEPWIEDITRDNADLTSARVVSLKSWWINNLIEQGPSMHEKVVFFWHNHLATQSWEVFWPHLTYQHLQKLRKHAFGNYRTMIKEITLDPQMLLFLNGAANRRESPDENYARELQELFCIGKGKDAKFTEGDVQAAARVLTGHSVDWENGGEYLYRPYWHDTGDKQFSDFYGGAVIKGREGDAGAQEVDDLIDLLFSTHELSRFVVRKLYRFFVYSDIDEQIEDLVIKPLADLFVAHNYEIKPVLDVLFRSSHFHDVIHRGAMIKSPLDFLVGFWRTTGLKMPEDATMVNRREIRSSMVWTMGNQGLEVLDPPNVAGYPAYHQFPQYDKSWISTHTITDRALVTDSFLYWGYWSRNLLTNLDLLAHLQTLTSPEDPVKLVEEITTLHLAYEVDQEIKSRMLAILLTGQQNPAYWTGAWNEYLDHPNDEMKKGTVEFRLKALFQFLFQLSEYHLQ